MSVSISLSCSLYYVVLLPYCIYFCFLSVMASVYILLVSLFSLPHLEV